MKELKTFLTCFLLTQTVGIVLGFPENSFVVTSTESTDKEGAGEKNFGVEAVPNIYEMQIDSNVTNRFARTLITSKVKNWNSEAREATFSVILPDRAFISEFVMVIGGKSYKAYVKEKEEAKAIYDQAVASGLGAAHVTATARESNRFTVSVNLEALSKATFLLTYEELLRLKDNQYELVINIHPNQPVKDLFVNVMINESRPLRFVKTAPLRSGNEISKHEGDLDPRANIFQFNETSALVQFKPNVEKQKKFAEYLQTDVSKGLSGQFVVQYDVERDPQGGEVLVRDGYFVHFFAPTDLTPLNKFIIFVLDTSGSMYGQKMTQLKEAMVTILDQLDVNDYFHIIGFETNTKVWNIVDPSKSSETPRRYDWWGSRTELSDVDLTNMVLPNAFRGTADNIKKAKDVILDLQDGGGTNIYEALQIALNLIDAEKSSGSHEYLPQPLIMFLTDGEATIGITSTHQIVKDITKRNREQAPIYSLSFGDYADKNFLKKLSQKNRAFSRHIYEASDAALQLQNFYKIISSPLLSNVKFEYVPEATSLTETKFPIHFGGSEIVVAGRLHTSEFSTLPCVISTGINGPIELRPVVERPITSLERLWAYLTIRQLLDEKETAQNRTANEKKALDLALKYSFVTPVSSLVVVKPNSTDSNIETEAADKIRASAGYPYSARGPPGVPGPPTSTRSFITLSSRPLPLPYSGHIALKGSVFTSADRFEESSVSFSRSSNAEADFDSDTVDSATVDTDTVDSTTVDSDTVDSLVVNPTKLPSLNDLKFALPWLANSLNDDGTLKSPSGGYELGLNATISNTPSCSRSSTNTKGHCKLLHECPQVHHLLTTEDTFVHNFFCPLQEQHRRFAGVCCS